MSQQIETLLANNGWSVECWSPLEIRHEDGSFATLNAAQLVIDSFSPGLYELAAEVIADIAFTAGHLRGQDKLEINDSRDLMSNIIHWACQFQKVFVNDLHGDDYMETVDDYAVFRLTGEDDKAQEILERMENQVSNDDPVTWTNHYLCPCSEHWEDTHDCCCNDRCPVCNREIEPYISDDGSVSDEAIDRAYQEAMSNMGLVEDENGVPRLKK